MKGRLYTEYYVQCGICEIETPVGARKREAALFYLKKGGWQQTTKHGYVCKQCQETKIIQKSEEIDERSKRSTMQRVV